MSFQWLQFRPPMIATENMLTLIGSILNFQQLFKSRTGKMHRKRRFETKIFTENSSLCAGTSALCWIESSSGASPRCSGFLFGFPMVPWAWNMWPITIWTTSLLTFVSRMIRMPSWTGSSCNWVLVTTLYLPCQSIAGYIYIYMYIYIYWVDHQSFTSCIDAKSRWALRIPSGRKPKTPTVKSGVAWFPS